MAQKLFDFENGYIFTWDEIETCLIKGQYNEMLSVVLREYFNQYDYPPPDAPPRPKKPSLPNFLNNRYCLTIEACNRDETGAPTGVEEIKNHFASTPVKGARLGSCFDVCLGRWFLLPNFRYVRKLSVPLPSNPPDSPPQDPTSEIISNLDFGFNTNSLTIGAVIWLYFYERMGIFKILGALLDDYNYRGKFTISGRKASGYSELMNMISSLHRLGISSNLRDRICLYQRVLGVSIENNLGVESERNSGFMNTFNRMIDYMLDYYKTKQLALAIQTTAGSTPPRSSVATQTSIRDTITVMKQHFEPLQYGRNLINTFLGIATVHATLCLINMLKAEIGIPAQYERPEEFIPAAYDILVAKRTHTVNEANRFILYDNCASYGYRLLTDVETIQLGALTTIGTGSTIDIWLDDIEGWVEGYRNAYTALPEKVEAIV